MAAIFDRFKGHHVCIIIVSLVIIFFLCCFIFAMSDKLFLVIGGGSVLLSSGLGLVAIWYMFQRGRIDQATLAEVRKIAAGILRETEAISTKQDSFRQLMESGPQVRAKPVAPPPDDAPLEFNPVGMPIASIVTFYSLLKARKTGKALEITELSEVAYNAFFGDEPSKSGARQLYSYMLGAVYGLQSVLPSGCIRLDGKSRFVTVMPKGFEEAITEAVETAKKSVPSGHMTLRAIAAIDADFNER